MLHPKQHIIDLSEICFQRGVKYIVISPGSRNAPLTEAFYQRFGEDCISIVDERSAGYFSLGLARTINLPVVMICTSGTAVLNYGPALAEARYQRIPLIAITADRPEELIDQQDNQTIRQKNVFKNIVKASYHLPQNIHSYDILQETHSILFEALDTSISESKGPVHINVPLLEPLYDNLPSASSDLLKKSSNDQNPENLLSDVLREKYRKASKVMIVHGQDLESSDTSSALQSLAHNESVIVIAENIANTKGEHIIDIPELLLAQCKQDELVSPELVIYSGGQIVSKKLKSYIRNLNEVECWRIGMDESVIDTFQKSNTVIASHHSEVYKLLCEITSEKKDERFQKSWLDAKAESIDKRMKIIQTVSFSDLKVYESILEELPPGANLELGNSSVIRYSQIFPARKDIRYYSNRGVSGIDGCLSTASGTAYASNLLTVAILGDLSFVYDSNALWNRELSSKLRIIVINNSGGDIFNLIDGPSESKGFTKLYKAHHPVQIQKLAEAFNLGYFCIEDEVQLKSLLPDFFKESNKPLLMEVKTNSEYNKISFDLIMEKTPSFDNPE